MTENTLKPTLYTLDKCSQKVCLLARQNFIVFLYNKVNGTVRWYGDGAGNIAEENSSIFSVIQMC